jgi:hypothetical protein
MRAPHRHLVGIVAAALVATAFAAASAAPAGAVATWHSNKGVVYPSWTYPGGFTTAMPGADWVVGATTVSCFFGWAVGNLSGAASGLGVTGPAAGAFAAATVTPKFASCLPGSVACQGDKIVPVAPATLSAGPTTAAYNGGTATTYAGAANRKTTGSLLSLNCEFVVLGVTCLTLTGSVPVVYKNPSTVGGTLTPPPAIGADTALDASLTIRAAGQSWAVAGAGCASLPNPGSGAIRLQKPGGGDLVLPLSGGIDQPVIWYGTL